MVLPVSGGISRDPPYSGSTSEEINFRLQGCYLLWLIFPVRFILLTSLYLGLQWPATPTSKLVGFGYFPFARRYLGNRILLYFPPGTKMFQFPEFVLRYLMYSGRYTVPLRTVGCPIRKSPDHSLLTAS